MNTGKNCENKLIQHSAVNQRVVELKKKLREKQQNLQKTADSVVC